MEIKLKTSTSIMYIIYMTEVMKEQIRQVSFRRRLGLYLLYDILICRFKIFRCRVSRFNNQSVQKVTDKPGAVRKDQHPTTIEEAIFKLSSVARPIAEGQLTQAMTETCKRIKITSPITSSKIKI